MLSDINRQVAETDAADDPSEATNIYGAITNKNVKRRTGRRPAVATSATVMVSNPKLSVTAQTRVKEDKVLPNPSPSCKVDVDTVDGTTTSQSSAARDFFAKGPTGKKEAAERKAPAKAPTLKRQSSSSIFASFAKAKPQLPREGTDSSAIASGPDSVEPSGAEDKPMRDVSDDDGEEYVAPEPKKPIDADRKSRKDREAALKAMMEDDDDKLPDEPVKVSSIKTEEPEDVLVEKATVKDEPVAALVGSSGRRRGKRKVMMKKTVKDEEGYLGMFPSYCSSVRIKLTFLVTREEATWESFSEDEPVVPKAKAKTTSANASAGAGRPKKPIGKAGQGSIMSFFGKK